MADAPQVLCFDGAGYVKLNEAAIARLVRSEGFRRTLEAVRELARETEGTSAGHSDGL